MRKCLLLFIISLGLWANAQRWDPIETRFDSLMTLCQLSRNHLTPDLRYNSWTEQMEQIADTLHIPALKWRTLYFKSALCSQLGQHKSQIELLDSALAMVDSLSYPYDYHRILWNRQLPGSWGNYARSYAFILQEKKFYESIDDPYMTALMYTNLGRVFEEADLMEKSLHYHQLAEDIFRQIGYQGYCEHAKIDKISDLANLGKLAEARDLYHECLVSPWFVNDTVALHGLLNNGFYAGIDTTAAIKAYTLAHEYGKINSLISGSALNMGNMYLQNGDPGNALPYLKEAISYDLTGDMSEHSIMLSTLYDLAEVYHQLGQIDSAYFYQNKLLCMQDSLNALNNQEDFIAEIESFLILHEEEKFELERQQAKWQLYIILIIGFALLLVACAFIWWLNMARKLKAAQAELLKIECEENARKLTTNTLELIEKKNLIQQINRHIEECRQEGEIDQSAHQRILNSIRTHNSSEEDMEAFYKSFNQVHPNFLTTLKLDYPTLTKKELRLCAFLRLGMDNKQIAHTLSVESEAVKKARQRMRKKFPLTEKDSLEDFLMLYQTNREHKQQLTH